MNYRFSISFFRNDWNLTRKSVEFSSNHYQLFVFDIKDKKVDESYLYDYDCQEFIQAYKYAVITEGSKYISDDYVFDFSTNYKWFWMYHYYEDTTFYQDDPKSFDITSQHQQILCIYDIESERILTIRKYHYF